MTDWISAVISGVSAIVAVVSVVAIYHQTRKGWYISVLAPQRLEWAENVRLAISEFMKAFYNHEDIQSLQSYRARIFLYLNPKNENHCPLINAVDAICNGEEFEPDNIITIAQQLLRWNWWTVKSEAGVSHAEEIKRGKEAKARAEWHGL